VALGALAAAAAGVPVLGAVLTPWLKPRAKEVGRFIPVTSTFELEPGVPKRVDLTASAKDAWAVQDSATIGSAWVIKKPDGQVVAFSTVCPHLGCPIGHSGEAFRCPCHDSNFGLDGASQNGPSPRGMDRLEVQVRDNVVSLRYARFKQGTREQQEL
jgi:Rieske Fe-S protein